MIDLRLGEALAILRTMPDNSVDAVVCDPPYGISFMSKHWDYDIPSVDIWRECFRVLKPGGHLLAFAGTRTQHRMACAIEDAGFEIRDMIAWVYGSGFPKSLDVSKAIDKAAGAKREVVGERAWTNAKMDAGNGVSGLKQAGSYAGEYQSERVAVPVTAPATDAARQWQGFGTALKPALEPITVARKPLIGTVVENVLKHGTGALNIDGCRVPLSGASDAAEFANNHAVTERLPQSYEGQPLGLHDGGWKQRVGEAVVPPGRWPANLVLDGSDDVIGAFPDAKGQQGDLKETGRARPSSGRFGDMAPPVAHKARIEIETSAARFFSAAKASRKDRGDGNSHPTVKPTDLMRYLVKLVTPPRRRVVNQDGSTAFYIPVILDPFMGSGSTGKAAVAEGFKFIGIEMVEEYFAIAHERITGEPYLEDLI